MPKYYDNGKANADNLDRCLSRPASTGSISRVNCHHRMMIKPSYNREDVGRGRSQDDTCAVWVLGWHSNVVGGFIPQACSLLLAPLLVSE